MLLSITDLTHQSWDSYLKTMRRFAPFLGVLLAGFVIRFFLGFVGLYLNAYTRLSALSVDMAITLIILAISFLGIWTSLAIIKETQIITTNQPLPTFKESYIKTAHYIIPMFLLSLLVAVIVAVGSVLFLIPGLIFAVWYYFVNYVVIFEDHTNLTSLKTSKQLVVGRWFSMAFRIILPKIVFLIGVIVLSVLTQYLIIKIFNPSTIKVELITSLVNGIFTTITLPLFIWSDTILYFNAKNNPVTNLSPLPPVSK